MLTLARNHRVLSVAVVAVLGISNAARAETPENKFHRGFYIERVEGDFAAAAGLYEEVVADPSTDDRVRSEARMRLASCREELACNDFAALMPGQTLVYVELNRPGEQMMKLLGKLGLLAGDDSEAVKGGKRVAISPALVDAVFGIRGAAMAITGFDPFKQEPMGVLVFHPGHVEVIRGLLESGLPIGGRMVEPIAEFPTYKMEDKVFITLTSRLVVVSPQRALVEGVLRRLSGQEKDSLAVNGDLSDALQNRGDSLLYFFVHAKPMMPMIDGLLAGASAKNRELAVAQALLDPSSLQTLTGRLGIGEGGLALDLRLRLDEGHHNLVFNLLRTPPIHRETLKCIPRGAAAFLVGALNEAPSHPGSTPQGTTSVPTVVTALDFGREIFANITSLAVYVLAPEDGTSVAGPPIPDLAAAITVNDPSKSQALWTQILGIASLATGAGTTEGATEQIEGVVTQCYRFPDGVTVYFASLGNDVVIASTKSAVARSLRAKRTGESILKDPSFAEAMSRIGPDTTRALFAHPGRCARIAERFMSPDEAAEMKPVVEVLTDTVVSAVLDHSDGLLSLSAMVTGIPDVGELVAAKIQEEEARRESSARLKRAIRSGRWNEALEVVDALLAESPENLSLVRKRFHILAVGLKDRDAALACGKSLCQKAGKNARLLNNFAWALITEDEYKRQYNALALSLSERSNELTRHRNWAFVDTLALARFETGDIAGAVELERKAIELAGGTKAGGTKADELQATLARFEQALDKGS